MSQANVEILEERLLGLSKIVDERFEAYKSALHLQAAEYERRLCGLNGEQGRIASIQAKHVSRELFDSLHLVHDKRISELEKFRSSVEGRVWGICLICGVIVTIINLSLRFVK